MLSIPIRGASTSQYLLPNKIWRHSPYKKDCVTRPLSQKMRELLTGLHQGWKAGKNFQRIHSKFMFNADSPYLEYYTIESIIFKNTKNTNQVSIGCTQIFVVFSELSILNNNLIMK